MKSSSKGKDINFRIGIEESLFQKSPKYLGAWIDNCTFFEGMKKTVAITAKTEAK